MEKNNKKNKKKKYAVVTVLFFVAGIGLLVLPSTGLLFVQTENVWEWPLGLGVDNHVTFTSEQISACASDAPGDMFMSIMTVADSVFEEGTWKNWRSGEGGNTLYHILPDVLYHVYIKDTIEADDGTTLRIAKETGVTSWKIDLELGWNNIVFNQNMIDACDSDNPVDILVSIDSYWDFMFEYDTWINYWYNQEDPNNNGGPLQHVNPDWLYLVHVTQPCTLSIQAGSPNVEITSTSWVASVAGVFCLLGAALTGTKIFMIAGK